MKVAVTGGLGVNGIWLVRALLERDDEVLVLDVAEEPDLPADLAGKVRYEAVDVSDFDGVRNVLAAFQPDAVAHLAALLFANDVPHAAFRVNILGSANVFEAARLLGIPRVVYTSSKAVFAPIVGEHGPPDYAPVPPTYPRACWRGGLRVYSMTKIACEDLGWHYADHYGLDFTALRFAAIYGPGKSSRHNNVGLHSRIVEPAERGEAVTVENGGDQADDMVYVKDVARSIVLALHCSRRLAAAYNIGSGRAYTLNQFGDSVRKVLPDAQVHIGGGDDYLKIGNRYFVMDIGPAEQDLGYRPLYDIDAGVADYVSELRRT